MKSSTFAARLASGWIEAKLKGSKPHELRAAVPICYLNEELTPDQHVFDMSRAFNTKSKRHLA